MQQSLNWGLAAALGTILLGAVIALYLVFNRLAGADLRKLRMSGWRILIRMMAWPRARLPVAPLLVIVPLPFNAEPFFTFTPSMLALESEGLFAALVPGDPGGRVWRQALINSLIIGGAATAIATVLG